MEADWPPSAFETLGSAFFWLAYFLSVMQKAASMASVPVLIFSPAVLVTFQGLIGNFAVFCHKFEHC